MNQDFEVTRIETVYADSKVNAFYPINGRLSIKIPVAKSCLVDTVEIRMTAASFEDGCSGVMSVVVESDLGSKYSVSKVIQTDILANDALALKMPYGFMVSKVVSVEMTPSYKGIGSLRAFYGDYGWSGRVLGVMKETYSLCGLPTIAVVVPVHGVTRDMLELTLKSVADQSYSHWYLAVYSSVEEKELLEALRVFSEAHPGKVYVKTGPHNEGISNSTNEAISACPEDAYAYAFLDCDDELHPDALLNVAKALSDDKSIDLLYTDEDKIDADGSFIEPHYKPDFNREMLFCQNYPCHLTVVSHRVIEIFGGLLFDYFYDGSQDHEMWLNATDDEKIKVHHIPKVLYHWRKTEDSVAAKATNKLWAFDAGLEAVRYHSLNLIGGHAGVFRGPFLGTYRVRKSMKGRRWPDIHIVIPTRDNTKVLKNCLQSLDYTVYPGELEVHVVDNASSEENAECNNAFINNCSNINVTYEYDSGSFNWSRLNNLMFSNHYTTGSATLFLNDDVEVLDPWWLEEMVRELCQKDVAIVGPKLLYPDGRIQHAGVVIGMGGIAGHAHKRIPDASSGYFSRHHLTQQVSAVTGACMLVWSNVFENAGRFNEDLPKAFNDIDFCMRVRAELKLKIVYTPWARLVHHESLSRGIDAGDDPVFQDAVRYMDNKWRCRAYRDPFFNPNLNLASEHFRPR